jgi:hypothetical protein
MRLQLSRALATCVAIGGAMGVARADEQAPPVHDIDVRASTEVGGYADTDHVFVVSPSIAGTIAKPTAGWSAGARYLVDVVSAASVDIVSTASRRWEEVRHAGSIDGAYKPGNLGVSANAAISSEPDYLSLVAGAAVSQDLLSKNLMVLVGFDHGHDVGGRTGTPFAVFSRVLDSNGIKGALTVVLDRTTVLSLVGDAILERGDPSKPYRYIPLFAPGTEVPRGASVDLVNRMRAPACVLEQLPLARDRFAVSERLAHRFSGSTLRLDERAYADSWGLKATTTDARFIIDLGRRVEMGPHLRFHAQTPVSFWQRAYTLQGVDFPALRTGDRELGPLFNLTGGGRLRVRLGPAGNLDAWAIGFDLGVTSTHYLDDLYIRQRLATLGVSSLELEL